MTPSQINKYRKLQSECQDYKYIIAQCLSTVEGNYDVDNVPEEMYEHLPRLVNELSTIAYNQKKEIEELRNCLLSISRVVGRPLDDNTSSYFLAQFSTEVFDVIKRKNDQIYQLTSGKGKPFPRVLE